MRVDCREPLNQASPVTLTGHRLLQSRLRLCLVAFCLSFPCAWGRGAEVALNYSTWSFGHLYNVYYDLLSPPTEVNSNLRRQLVTAWHQVAFDNWLISRGRSAGEFRYQRHLIRGLLHGYARDEARLDDPMDLHAKFVEGRMPPGSLASPLRGFDRKEVTLGLYKTLVSGFKDSFPDSTNLFPILPVVRAGEPITGDKVVVNHWGKLLSGKKWTLVSMEGFKSVPDRSPVDFCRATPGPERLYYIPAFMLACE